VFLDFSGYVGAPPARDATGASWAAATHCDTPPAFVRTHRFLDDVSLSFQTLHDALHRIAVVQKHDEFVALVKCVQRHLRPCIIQRAGDASEIDPDAVVEYCLVLMVRFPRLPSICGDDCALRPSRLRGSAWLHFQRVVLCVLWASAVPPIFCPRCACRPCRSAGNFPGAVPGRRPSRVVDGCRRRSTLQVWSTTGQSSTTPEYATSTPVQAP